MKVNLTGVELLTAGNDYIKSQLNNSKIKFQLLGTKASDHIEAIVYEDKVCSVFKPADVFQCYIFINEITSVCHRYV